MLFAFRGVSAADTAAVLAAGSHFRGRHVPPREIAEAVQNAYGYTSGKFADEGLPENPPWHPPKPTWPAPNFEQIKAISGAGGGFDQLVELSPGEPEKDYPASEGILENFLIPEDVICAGNRADDLEMRHWQHWLGRIGSNKFMMPSPVLLNPLRVARVSAEQVLAITERRIFLVVELDFEERARLGDYSAFAESLRILPAQGLSSLDLGAAILLDLSRILRLAFVVRKGCSGLQGWFDCDVDNEVDLQDFMAEATILGANPATWERNFLARVPYGESDGGIPEDGTVPFFNPELIDVV